MLNLRTFLSGKSHIIWDWNGTLLDDIDLCVDVISELLTEHKLEPVTKERYRAAFGFPVINYYRSIGFDFERIAFETVSSGFIERYNNRVHDCTLFDGTSELLAALAADGASLSILSAAHEADLHRLTNHFGVAHHFHHRFGISNHHAAGKIERGRQLIEILDAPLDQIILVGDTDHDMEVAKSLGIDSLLVSDGHQAYERLASHHPQVLRRQPTNGA